MVSVLEIMRDNCDGESGGTMMSRAMSYVINCTRVAQAERSCVTKNSETRAATRYV